MKILVIDDEPLVAKTLSRLLRPHEVQVIESSGEALEAICSGDFNLVFCDLMMPELSGRDLYQLVEDRDATLGKRFVFITGGAFSREAEEFLAVEGRQVLYKPFDRANLRSILATAESLGA